VSRPGLPGDWPTGYDDAAVPYTPAWQEPITGVPAAAVARIAHEFADNAERSGGRSMILMGAGTNHWFHSDTTYRAMLVLTTITGCQGKNGGGWAHYVGQEKCRPVTGWSHLAFGLDWVRPPRQMIGTAFWYLHTDQWRTTGTARTCSRPPVATVSSRRHTADLAAPRSARLGWMPSMPTVRPQPARRRRRGPRRQPGRPAAPRRPGTGRRPARVRVHRPGRTANWPAVLTVWRANLLGSSAKGNEYFLRHLLGTGRLPPRAAEAPPEQRRATSSGIERRRRASST
jgi:nitrate reductase alpha subunit